MKLKAISAFLLLLTVGDAQTILEADFNDGMPEGWTSRFGYVSEGVLSFHNRSTTTDIFTPALDLSGDGSFLLTFDLKTNAFDNNSLLIGIQPLGGSVVWVAGSPIAASLKGLASVLTGGTTFALQTVDLTPALSAFSPAERYGVRIAVSTWLNGAVSSEAIYLDNFLVVDPPTSAIAEPSCLSCIVGGIALAVVLLRKRCWHKWSNWVVLTNERYGVTYWRLSQTRSCSKCGKVQTVDKIS